MSDERPRLTIVMNDAARAIIEKTAEVNGFSGQVDQTIEECAELIVALRHYARGRILVERVNEERCDVLLMLAAMSVHLGNIDDEVTYKLETAFGWLKESE